MFLPFHGRLAQGGAGSRCEESELPVVRKHEELDVSSWCLKSLNMDLQGACFTGLSPHMGPVLPASECAALRGGGVGDGASCQKQTFLFFFPLLIHSINSLRRRSNTLSILKKSNQELSMKDVNGKKP